MRLLFLGVACTRELQTETPIRLVFKHPRLLSNEAPLRALPDQFRREHPSLQVDEEVLPASSDQQHLFYVTNLVEIREQVLILPDGTEVPIPSSHTEWFVRIPKQLRIGIRPEHLHLTAEAGLDHGVVQQVEHLGKEIHVVLKCRAYTLTMRAGSTCALQPGHAAMWTWGWEHVLCFDPRDERNVHAV
jgi:hypothetical protein